MMYAVKGSWVGQTFALAKCNEYEGKKSRIRRSKEERKAMVESFIQKYQSSNNGNFPSLNLTHKEVGGSFYTVREIIREIIQENRVLGPAKFMEEELNSDQFDNEYPLGTISIDLQTPPGIRSNGSAFVPSHQEGNNEEHESQMLGSKQIINGSHINVNTEDSTNSMSTAELQSIELLETEKIAERSAVSIANPITLDVVVETFPLRPVPVTRDHITAASGDKNSTETLEKNESEKVNMEAGNGSVPLDQIHSMKNSGMVDGQNGTILASEAVNKNPDLVNNKVEEKTADPQLRNSDCSIIEGRTVPDTAIGRNVGFKVSHNYALTSDRNENYQGIDRPKEANAPNAQILDGSYGSSSTQESKTPSANVIVKEAGVLNKETSEKGSSPTVDRIHLESWERASRNTGTEANPLVVIFKSFVTALVKLWSE